MDDYSISSLTESKNEWCARLVTILNHCIVTGIKSIYDEAIKLCIENEEDNKYLMTFQNLLTQVPQWNPTIIEIERKRIEKASGCKYLEDLITCVHIIQLKALTCIRVGQKQKKIDINIPSVDKFIHKIYVNSARKLYTNIYLFEKDILPLQHQKNNRELELLIKESILLTIRDNIPVDKILRTYMEETEEHIIDDQLTSQMNKKSNVLTSDISAAQLAFDSSNTASSPHSPTSTTSASIIPTSTEASTTSTSTTAASTTSATNTHNTPRPLLSTQLSTTSLSSESSTLPQPSISIESTPLLTLPKLTPSTSATSATSTSAILAPATSTTSLNGNKDENDSGNKDKKMTLNFSPVDNVVNPDGKEETVSALNKPPTNSIYTNNSVIDDDILKIGDDVNINLDIETL